MSPSRGSDLARNLRKRKPEQSLLRDWVGAVDAEIARQLAGPRVGASVLSVGMGARLG